MDKRRWDIVHKFEDESRRRFLKRLRPEEGFKILEDLYRFVYETNKEAFQAVRPEEKMARLLEMRSKFRKIRL